MATSIILLGPSGSGKSTSARNFNPEHTYYINPVGKPLPFKKAKHYNEKNKNYFSTLNYDKIEKVIKGISNKRDEIKRIIIDDAQYLMADEFMSKALEKGYTKFTILAQNMYNIMKPSFMQSLRDDLYIYYIFHNEDVGDKSKVKTIGKLLDEKITIEGLVTIVLHTKVEQKGNNTEYNFITNSDGHHIAKSPMGMFEDQLIPNDLKQVEDRIEEYYNN